MVEDRQACMIVSILLNGGLHTTMVYDKKCSLKWIRKTVNAVQGRVRNLLIDPSGSSTYIKTSQSDK